MTPHPLSKANPAWVLALMLFVEFVAVALTVFSCAVRAGAKMTAVNTLPTKPLDVAQPTGVNLPLNYKPGYETNVLKLQITHDMITWYDTGYTFYGVTNGNNLSVPMLPNFSAYRVVKY